MSYKLEIHIDGLNACIKPQAKVLQHILGHKDITTTYNTYGDVFDKIEFDNITKAENYLRENGLSIYGKTKPKIIKMA